MDNLEGRNDFLHLAESLIKDKRYLDVAKKLEAQGQKRVILDRESEEPYLVRYYLKNYRPYCRIVLHHILRSDTDNLHDHPWPANTVILSGGYWENKCIDTSVSYYIRYGDSNIERVWRPAGYHGEFSANYFHRLELDPEKAKEDTWTLFMMGPNEKEWGFIDEYHNWVQHEEYIANKMKDSK